MLLEIQGLPLIYGYRPSLVTLNPRRGFLPEEGNDGNLFCVKARFHSKILSFQRHVILHRLVLIYSVMDRFKFWNVRFSSVKCTRNFHITCDEKLWVFLLLFSTSLSQYFHPFQMDSLFSYYRGLSLLGNVQHTCVLLSPLAASYLNLHFIPKVQPHCLLASNNSFFSFLSDLICII